MHARYLLDTNTASYIIKGKSLAIDHHLARAPVSQIAISAITEAELRFGAARRAQDLRLESVIEDFLLRVTVLSWDSDAARQYGLLCASLERDGAPTGNLDLMIAARALALNAVLVTSVPPHQETEDPELERAFGAFSPWR
jgi:tRNA(fMet)-specific endonuclease VapC